MYRIKDYFAYKRYNRKIKIKKFKYSNTESSKNRKFFSFTFKSFKNRFLILLLMIMFIILVGYIYILNCIINPILLQLVESNAIYHLNVTVDSVVKQSAIQTDLSNEKLYDINYDNNGQVASSTVNLTKISRFKSNVSKSLQDEIAKIVSNEVEIPIGRVTGLDFLFDCGPKIRVKLISSGDVHTEFKSIFHHIGINQTKHEIQLLISAHFTVLLPNLNKNFELKKTVPIAESLIVGPVPNIATDINKLAVDGNATN